VRNGIQNFTIPLITAQCHFLPLPEITHHSSHDLGENLTPPSNHSNEPFFPCSQSFNFPTLSTLRLAPHLIFWILDKSLRRQVDQAALTGESLPVKKFPGHVAFSGSTIKQGETECLVYATGSNTFFGHAAALIAGTHSVANIQKVLPPTHQPKTHREACVQMLITSNCFECFLLIHLQHTSESPPPGLHLNQYPPPPPGSPHQPIILVGDFNTGWVGDQWW